MPKQWTVKTPKDQNKKKIWTPFIQVRDRKSYHTATLSCHTDISFQTDTSYNTGIPYGLILISQTFIMIIYHPGIISHHAYIISCWYIVLYHIIWYLYLSFADTISYVCIRAAALICIIKINTVWWPNGCHWIKSFWFQLPVVTEFRE